MYNSFRDMAELLNELQKVCSQCADQIDSLEFSVRDLQAQVAALNTQRTKDAQMKKTILDALSQSL